MPVLNTPDLAIHYETAGSGSPLVLIHGLGSSARDWAFQVSFLAPHFKVIAFDVRGHGRSGKPPGPYSVSGFAADAAALIEGLALGPAHVAGISMGGMIAFQLGLDRPELVRSLAVINSGPELVLRTPGQRMLFAYRRAIVRFLGMRAMGKVLARDLFPEPHQGRLRQTLTERWAENDPEAYLASLNAIVGWTVAGEIGRIRCPVLLLSADRDYTPVSAKQAHAERMANARVAVIRDSRHLSPLDQPARTNAALIDFLLQVP